MKNLILIAGLLFVASNAFSQSREITEDKAIDVTCNVADGIVQFHIDKGAYGGGDPNKSWFKIPKESGNENFSGTLTRSFLNVPSRESREKMLGQPIREIDGVEITDKKIRLKGGVFGGGFLLHINRYTGSIYFLYNLRPFRGPTLLSYDGECYKGFALPKERKF